MVEWEDLLIKTKNLDTERLLSEWRWLLRKNYHPVVMTAFGDWFLMDEDDSIHMLDLVTGTLTEVAENSDELQELLQQPDKLDEWFMAGLVESLKDQGMTLGPGQCFGYKVAPVAGGKLDPENIEPRDLLLHQTVLSHLHRQAREMPGTSR